MNEQDFARAYDELAAHINAKIAQEGGSISELRQRQIINKYVEQHPGDRPILSSYTMRVSHIAHDYSPSRSPSCPTPTVVTWRPCST